MPDIRTNHLLDELMSQPVQATAPGTKVVTVSQHKTVAGYAYFGTTVYTAETRKKDGKLVWRKSEMINDTTAGMSAKVTARAKAYAAANGLEYADRVRHGTECK